MVVKCAKRERKVNVVGLELERPSVLRVLMVESIVRSSPSQPAIAKQQKSQSRGSNFGSNLPVLWRPISGLNGAESTVNLKVNSRMCQKSKCHMWCRLRENGSHFSSSSCTQSCTQTLNAALSRKGVGCRKKPHSRRNYFARLPAP